MKRFIRLLITAHFFVCLAGCEKQREWLDTPRNRGEIVMENLSAFQAILDNTLVMNANYPAIGLLGCDHYFLSDADLDAITLTERNAYLWKPDIFEDRSSLEYVDGYLKIAYANVVLDGLKDIDVEQNQQVEFNNIKGQALFARAMVYFELASIFCKPYNSQTALTDLGLPLRLTSDVNEIKQRSDLKATYDQIINDLLTAVPLLPVIPKYRTRASKGAVYALLARVYLNMESYEKARDFSDSVVRHNELIDFNDGVPSMALDYRFPDFKTINKEVIFYAEGIGYSAVVPDYFFNKGLVDTLLYESYDEVDLRKKYFYEYQDVNKIRFRGTYTGAGYMFCGLGVNEAVLINAECNARLNDIPASLDVLNTLLEKRYERGKYVDYTTGNLDTLLLKIISERKKELPFSAQIRWQDLRRLNRDPRFAITLMRVIGGEIFTLSPNDPKYVYPIPQDEIDKTGIEQNER